MDLKPERTFIEPVEVEYKEPTGELYQAAKTVGNVGKWRHYFEAYENELSKYRGKPIKMLEIGIWRGGSLKMWREWLGPEATIVGVDINPDCEKHDDPDGRTHVRIGDQKDLEFLDALIEEFGPFDVILDDGGHMTSQQYTSFTKLFKSGLTDDGLYIVEDLHSNLWPGYVDTDITFLQTVLQLLELMHAQYRWIGDPNKYDIANGRETTGTMEYYEAWIKSFKFYDSMVFIQRGLREPQISGVIE